MQVWLLCNSVLLLYTSRGRCCGFKSRIFLQMLANPFIVVLWIMMDFFLITDSTFV